MTLHSLPTLTNVLSQDLNQHPNIALNQPTENPSGDNTGDNPSVNPTPVITDPIDTYLVLSSIGLYNGEKGKNIEEKMLENALVFNAKPGEDLPGKDQVTAVAGSKGEFVSWVCYEGTGFPTVYTKVPNEAGKILYALFENGNGSGNTPVNPVNPSNETTIYLDATQKLNEGDDQTWATGNAAVTMYVWSAASGDSSYIKMNNGGNGIYSASVNLDIYTNVIFLRHDSSVTASIEEGGSWNRTGKLLFVVDYNCFKITSWNDGGYWTTK